MELVVHFDFDEAVVRSGDMTTLDRHADFLVENPEWRVRIEGHADERGSDGYNLELGERRAQAVQARLASKGVAASRMDVVSFGESRPVASGSGETSWDRNRRVVVIHLNP